VSSVACAPPDAKTLVACPSPERKPAASEEAARAAALTLLEQLEITGVEADDVRIDGGFNGLRHVSVRRRVEGLPAEGFGFEIDVDATGRVVSASGQLAEPTLAGNYPVVPARELAQTLASQRMTTMICLTKPGVEGCAPPPPIVVTGARTGLSLAYPVDYDKGEAFLLPAWLFTIEGDPRPTAVVAVPSKYRADPGPGAVTDTGTIEPAPMPPIDGQAPTDGVGSGSGFTAPPAVPVPEPPKSTDPAAPSAVPTTVSPDGSESVTGAEILPAPASG